MAGGLRTVAQSPVTCAYPSSIPSGDLVVHGEVLGFPGRADTLLFCKPTLAPAAGGGDAGLAAQERRRRLRWVCGVT